MRSELSEEAKKARNEYKRAWNRRNKEKVREANKRYWEKKARETIGGDADEREQAAVEIQNGGDTALSDD